MKDIKELTYENVLERMVQYAALKPRYLYDIYRHFIPRSWQSGTPDRDVMLRHLYRFLMQRVVDDDINRLFVWYYKRMHGGKDIDPKTYFALRRGIEQAFAACTPAPSFIEYDPVLQEQMQDQDLILSHHAALDDN